MTEGVSEMATLLGQSQEAALMQLLSRDSHGYFTPWTLLFFAVVYFIASIFIYGLQIPSGLFVPSMIIGASLGRLVGELLSRAIASIPGTTAEDIAQVDPGMYALIGAAGILGGVTRMTISLTVILVEVTEDTNLLLPIMSANKGLKHTHAHSAQTAMPHPLTAAAVCAAAGSPS